MPTIIIVVAVLLIIAIAHFVFPTDKTGQKQENDAEDLQICFNQKSKFVKFVNLTED